MFRKSTIYTALPTASDTDPNGIWTLLQEKVTSGDLSIRLLPEHASAMVVNAVNTIIEHYEQDIISLTKSLNQAIQSSALQNNRLHHLASDSKTLNDGMQRIAAAIEQLSASIEQIAGNANLLHDHIHSFEEVAEGSSKKVAESAAMTNQLGRVVSTLQERMKQLTDSISSINHLIQLIKEIAEQTNLLSLNASIEAARAGEQGRGFSVVANEVKKLSDNTQKAVSEVVNQVSTIQTSTKNTNTELSTLTADTAKTSEISEQSKILIDNMLKNIGQSNEQIKQMAPAIQEHSSVFQEIASTVTELSGVTLEESEKVKMSAIDLFSLVTSLENVRSHYSLYHLNFDPNVFLDLALTDHMLLNWRLKAMMEGLTNLDEEKIGQHRLCRLGKWYYGDGNAIFGQHSVFIELEHHHEKIHNTAKEMIVAFKSGNKQKASELYETIDKQIGPTMVQVIQRLQN